MADIQGLLNSGATLQDILAVLYQDLEEQINTSKGETKTLYQEAMKSIEDFYKQASEERGESFQERYNLLNDNLANLGMNLSGDLANQWDIDTRYLTEAADTALATDLAWFEKLAPQQQAILDAILTEAAAQMAMTQIAGTGGGGYGSGGGGGYSSGGGYGGGSSGIEDPWTSQASVTTSSDIDYDYPGFIEAVQQQYANEELSQWAYDYLQGIINEHNDSPADMLTQLQQDAEEQIEVAKNAEKFIELLSNRNGFDWEGRRIPGADDIVGERASELVSPGRERDIRNALSGRIPTGISMGAFEALSSGESSGQEYDPEKDERYLNRQAQADWANILRLRDTERQDYLADIDYANQYFQEAQGIESLLREFVPLFGPVRLNQKIDEWGRVQSPKEDAPNPGSVGDKDVSEEQRIRAQREMAARTLAVQNMKEDETRGYWNNQQPRTSQDNTTQKISELRAQQERLAWQRKAAQELAAKKQREEEARKAQQRAYWENRSSPNKTTQNKYVPSKKKPARKIPTTGGNTYM